MDKWGTDLSFVENKETLRPIERKDIVRPLESKDIVRTLALQPTPQNPRLKMS